MASEQELPLSFGKYCGDQITRSLQSNANVQAYEPTTPMTDPQINPVRLLRRCRQCGQRTPDAQIDVCPECGRPADHDSDLLFFRGAARGWAADLGTTSLSSLHLPLLHLVLMVWLMWIHPDRLVGAVWAGLIGISAAYSLLKRLGAPSDSLVIACVSPSGFAQGDNLPRWPVLDWAMLLGYLILWIGGLFYMLDPVKHPVLAVLLGIASIALFLYLYRARLKSDSPEIAAYLAANPTSWLLSRDIAVKNVASQRVSMRIRVKDGWSGEGTNMEFEGDEQEAELLTGLLTKWRDAAIAAEEARVKEPKRTLSMKVRRWLGMSVKS